jgi:hypothetical protein
MGVGGHGAGIQNQVSNEHNIKNLRIGLLTVGFLDDCLER